MSFEPTRNRTWTTPTIHTSDNDLLGSNAECAVCLLPARVLDGPVLQFSNPRTALICTPCAQSITATTEPKPRRTT